MRQRIREFETTCDYCKYQEENRHFCLFHDIPLKNANIYSCSDWEIKMEESGEKANP